MRILLTGYMEVYSHVQHGVSFNGGHPLIPSLGLNNFFVFRVRWKFVYFTSGWYPIFFFIIHDFCSNRRPECKLDNGMCTIPLRSRFRHGNRLYDDIDIAVSERYRFDKRFLTGELSTAAYHAATSGLVTLGEARALLMLMRVADNTPALRCRGVGRLSLPGSSHAVRQYYSVINTFRNKMQRVHAPSPSQLSIL
ncbi:Glucosamine-6-phosphate deaminase [Frankliniella fusca]|uniref:Glucosamine-6-phosphate deaminase n=1 Tax=Frankliniella fusca TaxID=407009 RepID=A0AAE1LMQ7_9NEOP|nr:Glucosamine-6-phosphate deaminase [Frankliniella fusca]